MAKGVSVIMNELEVVSQRPVFEDERGAIFNLIDGVELRSVLYITSQPGSIRGNHYHKTQTQWVYLLEGRFDLHIRDTRDSEDAESEVFEMFPGDMMKIPARVTHAFEIKEYTEFIEVADQRQGGEGEYYDEDTVNVELVSA